jgi:tyrosine-protein phosphatase YwqE
MNLYRETHSSPSRQELIDRQIHRISEIKIQIQEVLKEFSADILNKELLQQAMEIHVKELMPELAKLQKLRNIVQEMNPVYEMVEGFMGQQTNQLTGYKLFQQPSSLGSIEFQHTAPKVVKYVRS